MRLNILPLRCGIGITALAFSIALLAAGRAAAPYGTLIQYSAQLDSLGLCLTRFSELEAQHDTALRDERFREARRLYKSVEYLVEYYYPELARKMNGPALPESEAADPAEILLPSGFQVLEAAIYEGDPLLRPSRIRTELGKLRQLVTMLQSASGRLRPDPVTTLHAIRLNIYRMAAKGLSGYDSPVAHYSLAEAATTIGSSLAALDAAGISDSAVKRAAGYCISTLTAPGVSYENFDYAKFFKDGLQPLLKALHSMQVRRKIPFAGGAAAVRPEAASFFEPGAFDPWFFAPDGDRSNVKSRTALGAQLFRDTRLSGGGRSCASCHRPELAYTDGLRVNSSLQRDEQLSRNTPTLLNAALQPALFWDARSQFLEDQAHDVISSKSEMDGDAGRIEAALRSDAVYRRAFRVAFPGEPQPVTEHNVCKALAAYTRSLISLNAPFDRYMRGDSGAMNPTQRQGFNIFMGKANCGSCHFLPLFNGAAPPDYARAEGDVLGVPGGPDLSKAVADPDRGMYLLHKVRHLDGAFRTPGLRRIAQTDPYMHNGVFRTLEEVVEFYDRGGGAGIGLTVPAQTLSSEPLKLNPDEKAALVAFLKAL